MSAPFARPDLLVLCALVAGLTPPIAQAHGDPSQGIDPDAGLPYWAWEEPPVEIRLIQRLPDQTRGFFIARGFSSAAADRIARSCVFQSIQRNRGAGPEAQVMDIDLTRWRLVPAEGPDSSPRPLALKETWDQEWAATGESQSARVAFRWSLFPTHQTFRAGDYNWGMISFGVPPGTRFDLTLTWTLDGEPREAILKGLICAPELDDTQDPGPDWPSRDLGLPPARPSPAGDSKSGVGGRSPGAPPNPGEPVPKACSSLRQAALISRRMGQRTLAHSPTV